MRAAAAVRRRTVTEIARNAGLRWTGGVVLAAAAACVVWVGLARPDGGTEVDVLVAVVGLVPPLLLTLAYVGGPMTRDLANGTVAAVLATAVRPRELVRGASGAVLEASIPLALAVPVALMLVGGGVPGLPLVLSGLVLTPLSAAGIVTLTVALALARGVEAAMVPAWLLSLVVLMGVPVGALLDVLDVTGWPYLLLGAVGAACVWLAAWATVAGLAPERLVERG